MPALLLAFLLTAAPAYAAAPPSLLARPPDFTLPTLSGNAVTLSKLHGKIVVVNFFATWCPPCRAETPDLIAAAKKYAAKGVVILGVDDSEKPSLVAAFSRRNRVNFPVVLDADGTVRGAYDVRAIPTTYVLDREGVVRYRQVDQLSSKTLSGVLDAMVAGKAIPLTKPAQDFHDLATSAAHQVASMTAASTAASAPADTLTAAIKRGTEANKRLDDMQNGPDSSAIDYFSGTKLRDELDLALADAYEARARLNEGKPQVAADSGQAASLRGQVAQDREQFADALSWYEKAIELIPKETTAYDGAYLAAYELRDYAKALQFANAEADVAPENPESWITVAAAALNLKNYDAAREAARKAVALAGSAYAKQPQKKKVAYEYGRTLLKLARVELAAGNAAAAKPLLRTASASAPETIVAQQADEQYAALAPSPVRIATVGAKQALAEASTPAALYVNVMNPSTTSRQIRLSATGVPQHWLLSFCFDTVCYPYKGTLTLAPGASKRVELQVVPQTDTNGPWTMSLSTAGESTVMVDVAARAVKAAITVSAR